MTVRMEQLRDQHIAAAQAVIREVCFEFFGQAPVDFDDMDQISDQYAAPCGRFLVLLDGDTVVGAGAIRRIDELTCELKRMWFFRAYRGKGYGTEMADTLLEFVRSVGYRCVRLDTSPNLHAANRLYRRLGFEPITRYNNGPCTTFMEKQL